jgi:hypothetical protein
MNMIIQTKKVEDFAESNQFKTVPADITEKLQKRVRNNINICNIIINKDSKWKCISIHKLQPSMA